jgi:hypothetical protein
MDNLAAILKKNDIDISTLRLLFRLGSDRVFAVTADGYDVFDMWEKLCSLVETTERWPVILGRAGAEDLPTDRKVYDSRSGVERRQTYPATKTILARAPVGSDWLAAKHRDVVKFHHVHLKECLEKGYEEDAADHRKLVTGPVELRGFPRAEWPDGVAPNSRWAIGAGVTHDDDMNAYDVTVGLFPHPEGWKVPAVMKFGRWNACPRPEEHCGIMRFWEDAYGARLACMTQDTVEFLVSRPPTTKKAALQLARDHGLYCSDSIYQGAGSLDRLAAGLQKGESWYFWWD